eukprot:scaffold34588_cov90-Isochrysis_galbana.AAC.2
MAHGSTAAAGGDARAVRQGQLPRPAARTPSTPTPAARTAGSGLLALAEYRGRPIGCIPQDRRLGGAARAVRRGRAALRLSALTRRLRRWRLCKGLTVAGHGGIFDRRPPPQHPLKLASPRSTSSSTSSSSDESLS